MLLFRRQRLKGEECNANQGGNGIEEEKVLHWKASGTVVLFKKLDLKVSYGCSLYVLTPKSHGLPK